MKTLWSKLAQDLEPYTPGEQPKSGITIKLNTNENPYGPSPRVQRVLSTFDTAQLKKYPDPEATALRSALAQTYGVELDEVFVGNGSDEVLAHAFQAFFDHERPILLPDVSYSFYQVLCDLYRIPYQTVPLDAGFGIDLARYPLSSGGIVLANPNAPTGLALTLDALRDLAAARPDQVIIVDEAYVDFGAQSAVALIATCPNILVVQTFSKSRSLAGARVGFAIGQRGLIGALRCVKNSFNPYPLGIIEQSMATAELEDPAHFETTRRTIMRDRDWLRDELTRAGFQVLPSFTNFLFVSFPGLSGEFLAGALRERGTLVRYWNQPRISEFVRISIGTTAECNAVAQQLNEIAARR